MAWNKAMEGIRAYLEMPFTGLMLTLLFAGLATSGKFSVTTARALFCATWIVGIFSIHALPAVAFLLLAVFYTSGLLFLMVWARPELVPVYWGRLIPQRKLFFSWRGTTPNRQLEIGDSGTGFIYTGPEGTPLFRFVQDDHLTIELIRGKIYVSAVIRDDNGHIVAEILRNCWKVAPPPKTWDRNYNRDTLEVRNAKGDIVLQVRVLNDRIQLQGEWHGIRLVKSDDPAHPGGVVIVGGLDDAPRIRAMFKYPSNEYFGQLEQ